jgi:signal transduction histidine kinase
MSSRNLRVRTKITALLLSLVALWMFAAWVTLREGLNLLWVNTIDQKTGQPGVVLVTALQQERRLSAIYLAKPARQGHTELAEQRSRTDQAMARFRELAGGSDVATAAGDLQEGYIREAFQRLDTVAEGRRSIDALTADRAKAMQVYNDVIDAIFGIYNSGEALNDQDIGRDSRTLIAMSRAKEILAREDALVAGALTAGRFTGPDHAEFVTTVGAQRMLHAEAVAALPEADRRRYEELTKSDVYVRYRSLEDRLVHSGRATTPPPVTLTDWQAAIDPVQRKLEEIVLVGGEGVVERATPVAVGVVVRLVLAGGLGLIAVVASIILSITTARALIQQLERLAVAARDLAEKRLPGVVERLGHGERVDVEAEAPPLQFGTDAIGQVGQAFNQVQKTAIKTAVEQAELRQSIRDILLSLARRTQSLVHRQLTLLDAMERRETDADKLKDLFRVDHLATRMRRNAENLIVLSGASPGRAWRRPVPMVDVVRGALAEVEDYTRVTLMPIGEVSLVGRAVGDVIHLLAELVENAVSFSPPYTMVQVSGQRVANGHVIEIEDRGLGLSEEDLAAANEKIAHPPEFNPANTAQLGLFVVSRLAERHGIKVALKNSLYGGTTAVVLIPRELIVEPGEAERVPADSPSTPLALDRGGPVGPSGDGEPQVVGSGMRILTAGAREAASGGMDGSGWAPSVPVQRGDVEPADPRPSNGSRPAAPELPPVRERVAEPAGPAAQEPAESAAPDHPEPVSEVRPAAREESKKPEMEYTPGGLPFRVPQASLAPALRTDGPIGQDEPVDEDDRSPEEIRKIMGGLQAGTRRGRSDAARLADRLDDPRRPGEGGRPSE